MMPAAEVRGMQPCPHCGVLLEGSLVAAIRDPKQEESCPKGPKPARVPEERSFGVQTSFSAEIPFRWLGDDRARDEQIRSLEERLGIGEMHDRKAA